MRFRKMICFIMMACMIVTSMWSPLMVHAASDTDAMLKVSDKSANPGAEVTVDVSIKNNPGVMGMALKVDYDNALTLTGAKSGEAFAPLTMTKPGKFVPGCKFVWDGQELAKEDIADGTILSLTFKMPDNVSNGAEYKISVFAEDPNDADLNPVNLQSESGVITVVSYIPGDVDGDTKINTTDVIKVRRYVAGGYDLTINEKAANVNGDTKINMTDVILMRRYIAGGYGVNLIPDSGSHSHAMVHTDKVEATCTESGNIEYWMCSSCGKYYTDVNGLNEITKSDTVIAVKEHTPVVDPKVEPTEDKAGLTEGSHCGVCNLVIKAQEEIPPLSESEDRYTITYHLYDGDSYLKSIGVENSNPSYYVAGTGIKKLTNMSAEGYIFDGWYDGEGASAENIKTIPADETGDIDLYAHWTPREYEISFDSPLVPTKTIKYTVNKGATLSNPALFGYTFMGWSDEHANIVTNVPKGTTGDITLTANWMSHRNQTRTVDELGEPIMHEDQENGQYLFMYEIGQIENVPLYEIKNFGNSTGIAITETFTESKSISESSAKSIVETLSKSTTKTNSWTLSKEWNDSLTRTVTHTDEHGTVTGTTTEEIDGDEVVTINSSDKGGTKGKVTTNTDNVTGTVKGYVEAGVPGGKIGGEVGGSVSEENSEEKTKMKTWNTTEGKNESNISSTNTVTYNTFNSLVSNTYGYNKTHSEGGSESTMSSSSFSSTTENEYASSLTYTTDKVNTTTKTYSNASAPEGYYRLVCAGTIHVFAVVGYDIETGSFYVYTMGIQDDKTYDFVDYSKTSAQFNDEENGALPFEIPYEINEIVAEKVRESKGLIINKNTGYISGYTGKATDIVVPDYIVEEDISGNKDVIQVKGIEPDAFQNNTNITSVRLGKYVTEIPASAFSGCTSLKSVEAPSITKIGQNAFKSCAALTDVTYSKVTEIGQNAFDGCISFSSYTITDKVTAMGANAFNGVKKIEVNASSVSVLTDACKSGAKGIVIYTGDIADKLEGVHIVIPETTEYFEWNGSDKTYKDVILSSKADKTVINKLNVVSSNQTPFKITSQEVAVGESTITSPSWAMILSADSINMAVHGDVILNSSGKGAILTKDLTLKKYSASSTAKLMLTGDAYVCSSVTDPKGLMQFADTSKYKVVTINESSFESLINDSLEWVPASQVPAGATIVDEKWTYDETTTKTSSSKTMAGYTLYDTTWAWGPYGSWSAWSKTKATASDSRKVETKTVAATYKTQYHYTKWTQYSNGSGWSGPSKGYWSGIYCQYLFKSGWSDTKKPVRETQADGTIIYGVYGGAAWYNQTTRSVVKTAAYTQYRYRDRSKVYTYHFKKVEPKESAVEVNASGNISNVQKWVKYVVL